MILKYQFTKSNIYYPIDYSKVSAKEYIQFLIDCVILADCSKLENIISNGLKKATK
ncbi:hypothetical protein [Hydrogenimonas thermophila]|uniref:hypothetical protein n=1 Tax=Hydrogenimonas thermophila TaxID=223786 RepID=UPI002936E1C8|nr:hypothetical protein [Hydrogenimonas thermophila]WOE71126.1 hypothetical protein RZR91_06010 [Hydrogenimonas thermophila]